MGPPPVSEAGLLLSICGGPPQTYTHVCLDPVNAALFGNGVYADVIRHLEMRRSFWISQVGPKCCHRCPCKKQAERDATHTEEKMRWRQRLRGCSHEPRNTQPPEQGEAGSGFSPDQAGFTSKTWIQMKVKKRLGNLKKCKMKGPSKEEYS